eukprot:scaffold178528_cov16-Tisochrysis_lutea.AAC.1
METRTHSHTHMTHLCNLPSAYMLFIFLSTKDEITIPYYMLGQPTIYLYRWAWASVGLAYTSSTCTTSSSSHGVAMPSSSSRWAGVGSWAWWHSRDACRCEGGRKGGDGGHGGAAGTHTEIETAQCFVLGGRKPGSRVSAQGVWKSS